MQDVGEDQFLVLLLMVQPQLDQPRQRRPLAIGTGGDEVLHRGIDVLAIGVDVGHRRTRQQAPLRPRMARAEGLVLRTVAGGHDFRDVFPLAADSFLVARGGQILLMDASGRSQLDQMTEYAEDEGCRRGHLLGYFGEA